MKLFCKTFGYNLITKQTQVAELMLGQCWHNVYNVAPTSNLRLFNVLFCLGITLVNVNLTIIYQAVYAITRPML